MEPTTNPQPTGNPEAGAQPVDNNAVNDPALAGAAADLTAAAAAGVPLGAAPAADPNAAVSSAPAPEPVAAPVDGVAMGAAAVGPMPAAAEAAPVAAEPVAAPVEPAPVAAEPAAPTMPSPEVTSTTAGPTMGAEPAAMPVAGAAQVMGVPDTTGLITPTPEAGMGLDGLPLTEPIMRPDLPPAPDPVKQELESPIKAAGPVPGSIGSAVSVGNDGQAVDEKGQPITDGDKFGPKAGGATPNVAFNDPATQADQNGQPGAPAAKKKMSFNFDLKNMNRGVLIVLIVVAAMIVIGLVAVLIMQLM